VQDRTDALLRQPQEYAARPDRTFMRCPSRAQVGVQVRLIRDRGRVLRHPPVLGKQREQAGSTAAGAHGNIKTAQDLAARAFGADHFFSSPTAHTSTSGGAGATAPGDIVFVDHNLPKSHHFGFV